MALNSDCEGVQAQVVAGVVAVVECAEAETAGAALSARSTSQALDKTAGRLVAEEDWAHVGRAANSENRHSARMI